MPWVQLNNTRQATLRRAVRNKAGEIVRWLEFPPREPVLINALDLPAIRADLGGTLMPMERSPDGPLRPVELTPEELQELKEDMETAPPESESDHTEKHPEGSPVVQSDPVGAVIDPPSVPVVPDPPPPAAAPEPAAEVAAAEPAAEQAPPPDINEVLHGKKAKK